MEVEVEEEEEVVSEEEPLAAAAAAAAAAVFIVLAEGAAERLRIVGRREKGRVSAAG